VPIYDTVLTTNSVTYIGHKEQIRVEGYNGVYILFRLEDTHRKLLSLFSNHRFIILKKVPVNTKIKQPKLECNPLPLKSAVRNTDPYREIILTQILKETGSKNVRWREMLRNVSNGGFLSVMNIRILKEQGSSSFICTLNM
jgi:hypothetical protein